MESNFTFTPPPFLGSGFRQNHQIRSLKSNSYPFLASTRSLAPSSSHSAPSTGLLTSRGTTSGFARTNLNSTRRKHLRRCYDLMHLCLQRRQTALAGRFLRIILAAHEWTADEGWRLALLLLSLHSEADANDNGVGTATASRSRIAYLQSLDLHSSAPFKATHLTSTLVEEYIHATRLNDAIELLEQRVNMHPYKSQPQLHTLLGMLYLFVGLTTLLNSTDGEEEGVSVRKLDRTTKNKARRCFETAIQATQGWTRGEKGRRQRVWGMHWNDCVKDGERVEGKRREVWGRDVMDDGEDGWPTEEHRDLQKMRRRLEGNDDEPAQDEAVEAENPREGAASDAASSASGSVYSASSSDDDDDEEEERGRSRTPSRARSHPGEDDAAPHPDVGPALPTKGPKSWLQAWPRVSSFYTPEPPFAYHLAEQFLSLLGPSPSSQVPAHASSSQRGTWREEEGEDTEAEEVGGIQLTREEAEERLRRILFEDRDARGGEASGRGAGESSRGKTKSEKRERKDKMERREGRVKEEKSRGRHRDGGEGRDGREDRKKRRHDRERESIVPGGGERERKKRRHDRPPF